MSKGCEGDQNHILRHPTIRLPYHTRHTPQTHNEKGFVVTSEWAGRAGQEQHRSRRRPPDRDAPKQSLTTKKNGASGAGKTDSQMTPPGPWLVKYTIGPGGGTALHRTSVIQNEYHMGASDGKGPQHKHNAPFWGSNTRDLRTGSGQPGDVLWHTHTHVHCRHPVNAVRCWDVMWCWVLASPKGFKGMKLSELEDLNYFGNSDSDSSSDSDSHLGTDTDEDGWGLLMPHCL